MGLRPVKGFLHGMRQVALENVVLAVVFHNITRQVVTTKRWVAFLKCGNKSCIWAKRHFASHDFVPFLSVLLRDGTKNVSARWHAQTHRHDHSGVNTFTAVTQRADYDGQNFGMQRTPVKF